MVGSGSTPAQKKGMNNQSNEGNLSMFGIKLPGLLLLKPGGSRQ